MIRTESEYRKALERLEQDREHIRAQRVYLEGLNIDPDGVERAMQPVLSFHKQLEEEIETFDQMRRGELPTLHNLSDIGRWLIGVRIARGLSQRELAALLGVAEAQISRDERNEYHGITLERAQTILQKMGVQYRIEGDTEGNVPIPIHAEQPRAASPELTEMPPPINVPGQVALYLRADRNLEPDKASRLAEMFRLAYEAAAGPISSVKPGVTKTREG
jgi:transcriptional regulator with XRE-family HTH domain